MSLASVSNRILSYYKVFRTVRLESTCKKNKHLIRGHSEAAAESKRRSPVKTGRTDAGRELGVYSSSTCIPNSGRGDLPNEMMDHQMLASPYLINQDEMR